MLRYAWLLSGLLLVHAAEAQVVQLPSMHTFTVQTSVLVPDSGGAYAGGVGRSGQGSISRGVPGWGPLGRNSARGSAVSGSSVTVHATIIDHEELDKLVLAEARALREGRGEGEVAKPRAGTPREATVGSVAAIKRELAAEDAATEAEAEQDFQKAVRYERAGELALARSYYRVAARKSTGVVKQQAMERLAALPAAAIAKERR